jgi:hypothetical protein
MFWLLLKKPDTLLYFEINGQLIIFSTCIFFFANIFKVDDVTIIYKETWCKIPCYTCIVLL